MDTTWSKVEEEYANFIYFNMYSIQDLENEDV